MCKTYHHSVFKGLSGSQRFDTHHARIETGRNGIARNLLNPRIQLGGKCQASLVQNYV